MPAGMSSFVRSQLAHVNSVKGSHTYIVQWVHRAIVQCVGRPALCSVWAGTWGVGAAWGSMGVGVDTGVVGA